ncbi:hypothetical protein PUW24_20370 [Paenibacillus urinalis]|uniref:Uncharacterized protein n=1 Tax=Paenibacillus urinalis TaxID=521520 RepID=A0AAX3MTQ7_9BACL|nr:MULTISPECIES: hypothetical protein [Paenibacillus]WDH80461.1 hypothetical protein PUW23_12865 [Paenibacillus urinalis]WDH96502.1 hypothetical protein PUW24_20370 [Paenibacillus urinalis]WDI00146.1 hypothetical protein PUW25_12530 [Paenibacillus urinalis]GAK40642.1 hypothetical protein TCA2_3132 [Paenibacillus sp. TCA20]
MKEITEIEAQAYGVYTKFDQMDNGESKFRLNCSMDGSSYCRTVIHTVKYGQSLFEQDWYASPELDELTRRINPEVRFKLL